MFFTKMHGLGNDFLVIDGRSLPDSTDYASMAVRMCHRNTGVGADGILVVRNSETEDIRMQIFNSDGSEAEMCGNGIRCFCKFVYDSGIVSKTRMSVETLAGRVCPELVSDGPFAGQVRVDMGVPHLQCEEIPVSGTGLCVDRSLEVLGTELRITSVLVGVPHTIVFVNDLSDLDISRYGDAIEHAPIFPKRTNVNFVHVIDRNTIEMRTWERGCGRTLCCGTGASSSLVACVLNNKTEKSVTVRIELGELHIDWDESNHVFMTGPAAVICTGEF